MMRTLFLTITLLPMVMPMKSQADALYPANPETLEPEAFIALPLGSIEPRGWLRDQLRVQAEGLTGHLDEFWPSVSESAWKGGDGDAWERTPYYLDGLVPLAYQLKDQRLTEKTKPFIEWMLSSGRANGWFGPAQNQDRWPLAVALKVLTQYADATGDTRVTTLLQDYFRYLKNEAPDWPDKEWRGVRAMENIPSILWLYRRTGDAELLEVADSIYENSFDWTGYFLNFPYPDEVLQKGIQYGHPSHVVNIGMAIKYPGLWYQRSRDTRHKKALYDGLAALHKTHDQAAGRFSGDEHLSGRHPSQGTELCGVVETMFSLENLIALYGDAALADRLESLAYNANPGACTEDYWAHQYDQQSNQVVCSVAKRNWSTNGDASNLYGLEPNYGCCTANMHQGWPKFVAHLWMASRDRGVAAVAYGPSEVTVRVGSDGTEVRILQETEYPFDGRVRFTISMSEPLSVFPFYLRIPAWAEDARIECESETVEPKPGTFFRLNRKWRDGDVVDLNLPMRVRTETRYNGATAILRGPLYYSLRIGEFFKERTRHHETLPVIDWEVYPTTPWNYGLILDPSQPEESIAVERHPIAKQPFAHDTPPVVLRMKGRAIPEWVQVDNSAGTPPRSPAVSEQPVTDLELIPYGSTRLRITEFPVLGD